MYNRIVNALTTDQYLFSTALLDIMRYFNYYLCCDVCSETRNSSLNTKKSTSSKTEFLILSTVSCQHA